MGYTGRADTNTNNNRSGFRYTYKQTIQIITNDLIQGGLLPLWINYEKF